MSDYSVTTDFSAKDALSTGDPEKLILGSDFDTEFDAIAVAVATKYDSGDIASQAQAEAETVNTVLMTPLRVANWADANAGVVGDLQALASLATNGDKIFGFDDTSDTAIAFTPTDGITTSGTNLILASSAGGAGLTYTSGVLAVGAGSGITVNANDVALTNQSATSSVPVGLSSGSLTFSLSGITELTMPNFSQSADKILVSDAGTLKVMPYDEAGIKVATVTGTTDTLAQADMNTFIEYTNAGAVTVTLNTGVGTVGNVVLIKQTGAGQVTIAGTATVESADSLVATRTTDSVICLVCIAANTWALYGDTA